MPTVTRTAFRVAGLLAALCVLDCRPTEASVSFFSVDVPTVLAGGTTFLPRQIVRYDGSSYSVELELPAEVEILALDRLGDGRWLFSTAHPVLLGGAWYEPRDVIAFDGGGYAPVFRGEAVGVPPSTRVDALSHDASGALLVSFDVPTTIGGIDYGRSDLVRWNGSFALAWSADGAGVPRSANLVGADAAPAGGWTLSFDVPTDLGAIQVLPGRSIRWNGSAFEATESATLWPAGSGMRDFVLDAPPVPPGAVPDGAQVPGVPLTIAKTGPGTIVLSWAAACGPGASDYEVYEGTIGLWWNHIARACSTGGATSYGLAPAPTAAYYLVVPRGPATEGSYGLASGGVERPQGEAACFPQLAGSCP